MIQRHICHRSLESLLRFTFTGLPLQHGPSVAHRLSPAGWLDRARTVRHGRGEQKRPCGARSTTASPAAADSWHRQVLPVRGDSCPGAIRRQAHCNTTGRARPGQQTRIRTGGVGASCAGRPGGTPGRPPGRSPAATRGVRNVTTTAVRSTDSTTTPGSCGNSRTKPAEPHIQRLPGSAHSGVLHSAGPFERSPTRSRCCPYDDSR